MASFKIHGADELALDIHRAGEIPDDVKTKIAEAGVKVLVEGTKEYARAMNVYDEESNVHIVDKVKFSKPNIKKSIKSYVTFSGTRKRGENKTKTRNAEIAFINEFGADQKGIAPRPFMKKAVKKYQDKAIEEAAKVFYKWLEKTIYRGEK